jgi:pentatricopeptide repeat protein
VKPDILSYNAVLNAWSRSGRLDAATQAQALFDELVKKYQSGYGKMKPDQHTFTALITAWGRSKRKDGASKAQAVFDDLLSRYQSSDKDLKPDVVVYNSLIGTWANAGVPEKAELILRGMESETSCGVKPDTITCGWSHYRMQALYDEMNDKYKAGDESVQPNATTFDTILSTWLKTGRKDKLLKAEAVFNDMHARYMSGEAELKPLVDKFESLFKANPVSS